MQTKCNPFSIHAPIECTIFTVNINISQNIPSDWSPVHRRAWTRRRVCTAGCPATSSRPEEIYHDDTQLHNIAIICGISINYSQLEPKTKWKRHANSPIFGHSAAPDLLDQFHNYIVLIVKAISTISPLSHFVSFKTTTPTHFGPSIRRSIDDLGRRVEGRPAERVQQCLQCAITFQKYFPTHWYFWVSLTLQLLNWSVAIDDTYSCRKNTN